MGSAKKSASEFFELLRSHRVTLVADVRRCNHVRLNGFTQADNLAYLLPEFGIQYQHWGDFVPLPSLLGDIKSRMDFNQVALRYKLWLRITKAIPHLPEGMFSNKTVCILGTKPSARRCHRRLAAEIIQPLHIGLEVQHL
jgi:uncharacterized protein (DUF488 family)